MPTWNSKHAFVICVVLTSLVSGCPAPPATDDASLVDATPSDAGRDVGLDAPECGTDAECDDGLFCSGVETCDGGRCMPGPVACDDGIECTVDACDESLRSCAHDVPDLDADGYGDAACLDAAGVPLGNDCADDDAASFPGNHETCDVDGHDEDCDPATHGGTDADSDGYESSACCNPDPAGGAALCGVDCDDARAATSPVGTETCDGLDQNCDGTADEGTLLDGFDDLDFDGYGGSTVVHRCAAAVGFARIGGDCDDANPSASPGLPELCDLGAPVDNNCDGSTTDTPGTTSWYDDDDGDGFGSAASGVTISCEPVTGASLRNTDCNDARADVSPASAERCDGIDDDCNGTADFLIGPNNFEDDDGDGLVDIACVPTGTDCDDTNPATGPGETESCDGRDNDCDTRVDEGATSLVYYRDADADGFGSITSGTIVACMTSAGYVARAGDCNDADAARFPGASELCDAGDNDCDSAIDEAPAAASCAAIAHATVACFAGGRCGIDTCVSGYSDCNRDPSDGCEAMGSGPGTPDVCDGADNDCDMRIDEDAATRVYYRDFDGDGYGSTTSGSTIACGMDTGYVTLAGDCNDADITRHPGANELCDLGDNDCDSAIDESPATASCGAVDHGTASCVGGSCRIGSCTGGYADCNHDPSDGCEVAGAGPGVPDVCDGLDNDCDTRTDEDAATRVYYRDLDGDGFGSTTSGTTISCSAGVGYVATAGDCVDTDDTRYPGAAEQCDAADNDCDSAIDETPASASCTVAHAAPACVSGGCAIGSCTGGYADCNHDPSDGCEAFGTGPGTPDVCDGVDNDCDSRFDEDASTRVFYRDADADTFGSTTSGTVISCVAPAGYVSGAGDCNDTDDTRYPGASEQCDAGDNDCDSAIDEAPATASCGTIPHGVAGCLSGGHCGVASCASFFGDCNADSADGCEAALSVDVNHCGTCAIDCNDAPRVTGAVCEGTRCRVTACALGYDDCDAFAANGCETGILSDPLNCGTCGHTCGVSEVCSAGVCALGCAPGLVVCDGRCVNPLTDVGYCGASGACGSPSGSRGSICRPGEACASGACFASFISPGIDAVSMTWPRDVTYTLDAPGAATIFYTLDGTVPGVSGSTVTAAAPVSLLLGGLSGEPPTPRTIRWVAQFGGGGTETIVHEVQIGWSYGYAASLGEIAELLDLNGEGPVAAVSPGGAVTGSVSLQHWRSDASGYCPGCVIQANLGVDGVGQVECHYMGSGSYPGDGATHGFSFTAPTTPGRYYVRAGMPLDFACYTHAGGGPIGVLYVR